MKQSKNKTSRSVEEVLQQSDAKLTSGWPALGSLVMAFEGIEWRAAGAKAREILKEEKADTYVKEVRAIFNPIGQGKPSVEITQKKKVKPHRLNANYSRLLKIATELEGELRSGKEVYGTSQVTGYKDLHLELINKNKRGYYLSISHYSKRAGDKIADPEMVILVDVKNQTLEALTFQNAFSYEEVYDNYLKPTSLKPRAKKSQNAFLETWLINLINEGHQIEFEEDEGEAEPVEESDANKEEENLEEFNEKVEVQEQTSESHPTEIENTVKYSAKLVTVIEQVEGLDKEKAEEKAADLKQSNKAEDYVIRAFSRKSSSHINALYKLNYQMLLRLIPSLKKGAVNKKSGSIKRAKERDPLRLKFEGMQPIGKSLNTLSIRETAKQKNGMQIIAFNRKSKKAWLLVRRGNFDGKSSYDYKTAAETQTHTSNKELSNWLKIKIKHGFVTVKTAEKEEKKKAAILKLRDDVNNKIPDLDQGKVKLVEDHKKADVDQKDSKKSLTKEQKTNKGKIAAGVTLTIMGLIGLALGIKSLKD